MAPTNPARGTTPGRPVGTSGPQQSSGKQPAGRPGAAAPPPQQHAQEQGGYPPPESQLEPGSGHQSDSGGLNLGRMPAGGTPGPSGGLVHDLCRQSMDWHAYALMQVLGVAPDDLAQIMRDAADALGQSAQGGN